EPGRGLCDGQRGRPVAKRRRRPILELDPPHGGCEESIAIDPSAPTILYVVESTPGVFDGSIWRSTDGGMSWGALAGPGSSVGFVRADSGVVWTSTGELYRSYDRGASWTRVLSYADLGTGAAVLDLAVDPRHSGILY